MMVLVLVAGGRGAGAAVEAAVQPCLPVAWRRRHVGGGHRHHPPWLGRRLGWRLAVSALLWWRRWLRCRREGRGRGELLDHGFARGHDRLACHHAGEEVQPAVEAARQQGAHRGPPDGLRLGARGLHYGSGGAPGGKDLAGGAEAELDEGTAEARVGRLGVGRHATPGGHQRAQHAAARSKPAALRRGPSRRQLTDVAPPREEGPPQEERPLRGA
mmetsp:Transcript_14298/g.36122  ORF Transcript_14298/g.36122 Transcript_14298/m.36122 type:complete len:215 (-) Transcript_14298:437-1081(-)